MRGVIQALTEVAGAPSAVGPYSLAVAAGGFLFLSGQIPLNPAGELVASDDALAQFRQVISNCKAVLAARDLTLANVVKTTLFLRNMGDFAAINAEYAREFSAPYPARSTIEVSALPRGALVEMELVATLN